MLLQVECCHRVWEKLVSYPLTVGVVGLLDDKDSLAIFEALKSKIDKWFLVSLDPQRSMNRGRCADSLKTTLIELIPEADVHCFDGPEEGFTEACRICNKEDRIVVCGSFVTVSAVWPLAEKFLKGTEKGNKNLFFIHSLNTLRS